MSRRVKRVIAIPAATVTGLSLVCRLPSTSYLGVHA
jgi:hypothetical protein